jgi:flagellar biosynthesis/type III secretory pathway protein FliH
MQNRHGPKARAVVERAIELSSKLPAPLRRAQMRAIVSVLSERMLALLKEAAMDPNKIPETPAARKLRLFLEAQGRKRGRIEGEAKGRAEGLAEGRAEGRTEGHAEGELKGKQDALLALLKARGLTVTAEQRAALRSCADLAKLDQWIVQAATAIKASDVLKPITQAAAGAPTPAARRSTRARPRPAAARRV